MAHRRRHPKEEEENEEEVYKNKPNRDNPDNIMSYLLKVAKYYDHETNVTQRNQDYMLYRFNLNRDNLSYIVRTVYEFSDIDYWRDLEIIGIDARFLINGHFFAVSGLNQDQLFQLTNDLYNSLINNQDEAKHRFMKHLGNFDSYYSEGFFEKDLDNASGAEMWLKFTLKNDDHTKNIDARLEEDYLDIANNVIKTRNLANLDEINEIEEEEEPSLRQQEKRHRLARRIDEELQEQEDPFLDEAELDAELRNREFLRLASDLESNIPPRHSAQRMSRNIYRQGQGIANEHRNILRQLKSYFKFQPWTS